MQTRIALLASTAIVAFALATPADAKGGGWYVNVTGGANWLNDDNFLITAAPSSTFAANVDADTGFVVAGAIGLHLGNVMNGLRAEVEASYRQNQVDGVFTSNTAATPQTGVVDYDHTSFAVLANVWWDIPLGSGFTPYVGGGVGWADTNVDGTFTCLGGGSCPVANVAAFDNSEDGFAWQLGAGVNFAVSPNVDLGVGYRYFQGPEPFLAQPFFGTFTRDVENQNHAAVVTLTFSM